MRVARHFARPRELLRFRKYRISNWCVIRQFIPHFKSFVVAAYNHPPSGTLASLQRLQRRTRTSIQPAFVALRHSCLSCFFCRQHHRCCQFAIPALPPSYSVALFSLSLSWPRKLVLRRTVCPLIGGKGCTHPAAVLTTGYLLVCHIHKVGFQLRLNSLYIILWTMT